VNNQLMLCAMNVLSLLCSYRAAVGRCYRFSSWRRRGNLPRRRRSQTQSLRGSKSSWSVHAVFVQFLLNYA